MRGDSGPDRPLPVAEQAPSHAAPSGAWPNRVAEAACRGGGAGFPAPDALRASQVPRPRRAPSGNLHLADTTPHAAHLAHTASPKNRDCSAGLLFCGGARRSPNSGSAAQGRPGARTTRNPILLRRSDGPVQPRPADRHRSPPMFQPPPRNPRPSLELNPWGLVTLPPG